MSTPTLELTIKGTDKIVAHACGKCRRVVHNKEAAERCCMPTICVCGKEARRGWTICDDCSTEKRAAQEKARFEHAEKISWRDYEGPVTDGFDFYESVESYFDTVEEPSPYVWACTKHRLGRIGAGDLIDSELESGEHHETARDWIVDEDGLQGALDAWVAKQKLESWMEDSTRAVLLEGAKEEIWPSQEDLDGRSVPAGPSDGTAKRKGN